MCEKQHLYLSAHLNRFRTRRRRLPNRLRGLMVRSLSWDRYQVVAIPFSRFDFNFSEKRSALKRYQETAEECSGFVRATLHPSGDGDC
jgi:hypothetical protein